MNKILKGWLIGWFCIGVGFKSFIDCKYCERYLGYKVVWDYGVFRVMFFYGVIDMMM